MSQFVCNSEGPIVSTKQGKVRGYFFKDVYHFLGIQYGEAERFHRARMVRPFKGIKDALHYGCVCPLLNDPKPTAELLVPHRYWPQDEDCLNLNIWTRNINNRKKLPVLVWFHGGGFTDGSAIEQCAYDGYNLVKKNDVVVVTVNHRLNILGYFDLSEYSEEYAHSANLGNEDLIVALKWIRDNISAFGGDPDNVCIYGQSGGGGKVMCLMQMKEADGLYHKAVIMSGVTRFLLYGKDVSARKMVDALLKKLKLKDVKELETVEYRRLALAYKEVSEKLKGKGYYLGCMPKENAYFKGDPISNGFHKKSLSVPLMVGTVISEFSFAKPIGNKRSYGREDAIRLARDVYGEEAERIIDLYHQAYPDKPYIDALYLDSMFRKPSLDLLKKRSQLCDNSYAYLFSLEFDHEGGKEAWHCSDIPFVFDNLDLVPSHNIEGVTDQIAEDMSKMLVHFASTGKPDTKAFRKWKPCKDGHVYTMVIDRDYRLEDNYDDELIELHCRSFRGFGKKDLKLAQH